MMHCCGTLFSTPNHCKRLKAQLGPDVVGIHITVISMQHTCKGCRLISVRRERERDREREREPFLNSRVRDQDASAKMRMSAYMSLPSASTAS